MMIIAVLCAFCLVGVCYAWRRRAKASTSEPPVYSGALPFIGHAFMAYGDTAHLWTLLQKMSAECIRVGGMIRVYAGPLDFYFTLAAMTFKPEHDSEYILLFDGIIRYSQRYLPRRPLTYYRPILFSVISEPDDALTAMNTSLEKSVVYNFAKRWIGEGLVLAKPQAWKKHRKLLNPMFTQKALNGFVSVFNFEARRLVNNLEPKLDRGPFEYERLFLVWSLETICHSAMGVNVEQEGNENKNFVQAINDVLHIFTQRFTRIWLFNECIYSLSGMKRKENRALGIIQTRSSEVLCKRKKIVDKKKFRTAEDTSDEIEPFIDHILMSADKKALTDAEVMSEVNTFIATGYDTTGHALIYTLMTLGAHQEVQDRVYQELEIIFGNSYRDIEKDDFSRMVYMDAVIKESLRLYPVVPVFGRFNSTEINLNKYTLPANSNTFALVLGMCRHPMWGADADQFKPERWLDPACLPDNPNAYPVFGLGKRSCIGKTFAMMAMKTTLAHLLRRYKVTSHNDKLEFKMEVVLKSVTPLRISIENRK